MAAIWSKIKEFVNMYFGGIYFDDCIWYPPGGYKNLSACH